MTNQQGAPEALRLADSYAKAHAMYCMEDLYGTSKSYTAELLKERHAARERLAAALVEAQQPAPSAAAGVGTNTKTAELLSTTVGLLMGYREGGARQPYKPGSVIAKVIDEVVDYLKDWPYPEPSPTPQADGAHVAAPADTVVLDAALRAIHQAIDLIGEPDTERLRTVRRVLRGAVVVAEDGTPQADSQPAPVLDYPPLPSRYYVMGNKSVWSLEQMRAYVDADRAARAPADSVLEDADPIRALIAQHAAILDQNELAYFELCYHRVTGWMAWITDKPLCMPPVISPDRKVLAQGQGDTADEACRDAARKQGGAT